MAVALLAGETRLEAPEYSYARRWVEEHNPDNALPEGERLFLAYSTSYTAILRFREGINLREIIDQTKLKGKEARVLVLRGDYKFGPILNQTVKPSAQPPFALKPGDVIWLTDVPVHPASP